MTARFTQPHPPQGRILLMSGAVAVGVVFPPVGEAQHRHPWVWRLWVDCSPTATTGSAKTEQAAKNALLAAWRDFMARAGLVEQIGVAE